MFRTLYICVLFVAACSGCRPPPCHWSDASPAVEYFIQIASKVVEADRQAQNYCKEWNNAEIKEPGIKESHRPTAYNLIFPVPSGVTFEVQVQNRVLMILPSSCTSPVNAWTVRVLPTYVDAYNGRYTHEDGLLSLYFPYKYNPRTGGNSCDPMRSDPVILKQVAKSQIKM